MSDPLADELVWQVEHGALGVHYRFTTIMARDAWIERHFPKRKITAEEVPGLYDLPDGRQLSVLLLACTVYDA